MLFLWGAIWGIGMGVGFMSLVDWWFDRCEDVRGPQDLPVNQPTKEETP